MPIKSFYFKALFVFSFFLILFSKNVSAQYYNYGQEPTRTKWRVIETDHYRVIFPDYSEDQGLKVAGLLDAVYPLAGKSLQHNHKKWDVILHTKTSTGLAYVAPTPSRSDWFLMQSQSSQCMDWENLLAAHETRHMVQQSKIEAEVPKIFKYLLGQQVTSIIIGAYLPFWFMEGDATCNETALGYTGSGRMPQFFMENRAQLVEFGAFSFNKSYLGSYKHHTADAYQMGYLMIGGSRNMFQKVIWDSVIHNVARKPLAITPFNKGIKNSLGISKYQLFDTIYNHYTKQWNNENLQLTRTLTSTISKQNKYYSTYVFGTKLSNGKYFAGKTSLNELNRLVLIDSLGHEKKVFTSGWPFLESVSAKDSMVVWSEGKPHVRWEYADKSILRLLNLNTGKLKEFKHKKRYVAPTLSPDKSKIAVVEDDNGIYYLRIISSTTGELLWSFETLNNEYFITPAWSSDGKTIACVLLKNNKQAIVNIDIESKNMQTILPFTEQYIKSPVFHENSIFFIGGYTGIDNVYSIGIETGSVQQETSVPFGAWNPSIVGNELIYSNYRSTGYELVSMPLNALMNKSVELRQQQVNYPIAETLTKQEGQRVDFENLRTDFASEKYSKLKHILNFHSWGPFAMSPVDGMVYPGVSLMSQNVMGTTELQAGYLYNTQDRHGAVYANLKYKGLFPIFESNVEYGKKSSEYQLAVTTDTLTQTANWNQTTFDLNMYVPLNLSKGKYLSEIEPRLGYQLINKAQVSEPATVMENGNTNIVNGGIYLSKELRRSRQDIIPDFGISFDVNYFKTLDGTTDDGYMTSAENWLNLPGIGKSHGIKVYNGYQQKKQSDFVYNDIVRLARGYRTIENDELYTFGVDYVFPFAYPDFTLLKTLYFKRFKAALFYDQSWVSGKVYSNNSFQSYQDELQSTGIELTTDLHIFQIISPFDIGVRANYRWDNTVTFDFMLGASVAF